MSQKTSDTPTTLLFGGYEASRLLGEGGMGQVHLGRRLADGMEVVIKVLHKHLGDNPKARRSFERETDLLRRFSHPHAVALFDALIDSAGQPCLILEYVPGITLEELLAKKGRLDHQEVGKLLGQLCQVLHAAHAMGILHRDLTLANLMVIDPGTERQHLKVLDFGLARMGTGFYLPLERLTGNGQSAGPGTPDYVCPEQIRGEEVDQRGDLYSVGVVLFKLLTGRLPFQTAQTAAEILDAHVQLPPPRMADLGVTDVPAKVEAVVLSLLAKEPRERPATASELAQRYGEAIGRSILDPSTLVDIDLPPAPTTAAAASQMELDRMEAWMPQQVALMKLRGFIQEVGGEVLDSEPGLVRVRLLQPLPPVEPPPGKGLLALFSRKKPPEPRFRSFLLELHLEKKPSSRNQTIVEIKVLLGLEECIPAELNSLLSHCQDICRQLRAYLMIR